MSLYESLDRFVGAGLLSCAPAFGCVVPPGAIEDGERLSRFLHGRAEGAEFGLVLDTLAQEIWLARDRRGFPQELCESHALALAGVLDQVRPGPEHIRWAIQQPALARRGDRGEPTHQLVAAEVVARARAGHLLQRAQLIDEVSQFLLEQLFAYLLAGPCLLVTVRSALIDYTAALRPSEAGERALPPPVKNQNRHGLASQRVVPFVPTGRQPAAASHPEIGTAAGAIAARYKLSEGAQRRFHAILSAQNLHPEQRLERLEELARWLEATVAQLLKPGNQDPGVGRLKAAAASALAGGDFEGAFELLQQVRRALREGRRQIEARLADEIHNLRHQMAEEAASTARLAELALARFDYDAAAELFAEAAGAVPKSEPAAELGYLLRRAEAFYRKGVEQDDRQALAAAAAAYGDALRMFPREHDGEAWAQAKINQANALGATAGIDAAGNARLEDAAAAYRQALEVIERGKAPLRWAMTQLSLGTTLIRLGETADRQRHWRAAAAALVPALEIFEQQGAAVYAEFARLTLRQLHEQLEPARALERPARTA